MKNKKIFGIIHYFDLLILIVLLIIGIGVGKYVFQGESLDVEVFNNNNKFDIVFLFSGVRDVTYENIHLGDDLFVSETNKKIGKVINIEIKEKKLISIDNNGNIIEADHPEKKDVYVTIEGNGSDNGLNVVMGNKIMKIGVYIKVYNKMIESTPIIYGIDKIK